MDLRESAVKINKFLKALAVALRCRAPIGEWTTDHFDVLADRAVVGSIVKATLRRRNAPWIWDARPGTAQEPRADASITRARPPWRRSPRADDRNSADDKP
jgi:hypothetical protein